MQKYRKINHELPIERQLWQNDSMMWANLPVHGEMTPWCGEMAFFFTLKGHWPRETKTLKKKIQLVAKPCGRNYPSDGFTVILPTLPIRPHVNLT